MSIAIRSESEPVCSAGVLLSADDEEKRSLNASYPLSSGRYL
jgi:hypothetical protein